MKRNYYLYLVILLIVLLRGSFINMINNISSFLFIKDSNLEIMVLNNKINKLNNEYNNLLTFKNNININDNYIITNAYMNNYSYDKLLINGISYQIQDEVVNSEGLVGLIKKIDNKYSEVSYIYDTHITVKINENYGKIIGKTVNNDLIVKQLSNYNNININDKVYSIYNTYIGKVIKINKEDIDTEIIVKTVNMEKINYLAVLSRQV